MMLACGYPAAAATGVSGLTILLILVIVHRVVEPGAAVPCGLADYTLATLLICTLMESSVTSVAAFLAYGRKTRICVTSVIRRRWDTGWASDIPLCSAFSQCTTNTATYYNSKHEDGNCYQQKPKRLTFVSKNCLLLLKMPIIWLNVVWLHHDRLLPNRSEMTKGWKREFSERRRAQGS